MFKTTLNEFKNRDRYIKDDFRFKDVCRFGKQNPRKFIKLWAEKEMYNLNRYVSLALNCMPVYIAEMCPMIKLSRCPTPIVRYIGWVWTWVELTIISKLLALPHFHIKEKLVLKAY